MAISFRIQQHSIRSGVEIAEILLDGEMVATMYPNGEKCVRIVSAHFDRIEKDDGHSSAPPIPHVLMSFDPQPYSIEGNRIVKHPTG